MIVACGTDDGKNFTRNHFGDSKLFLIYKLDESGFSLVEKIANNSPEEEHHGDPVKAGFIGKLLKQHEVQGIFAFAMGPNIVRMRKNFLPIISRTENINEALKLLQKRVAELEEKFKKQGDKEVIYVAKES